MLYKERERFPPSAKASAREFGRLRIALVDRRQTCAQAAKDARQTFTWTSIPSDYCTTRCSSLGGQMFTNDEQTAGTQTLSRLART